MGAAPVRAIVPPATVDLAGIERAECGRFHTFRYLYSWPDPDRVVRLSGGLRCVGRHKPELATLEGPHSEWDAGPPACGALGIGEGAASSSDGASDRDRMMSLGPRFQVRRRPYRCASSWMPTKCFSSRWAKFMAALFGPCQAAWIRRLVEFSITPTITLTTTYTAPMVQTVIVAQSARVQISRSVRLVG